MKVSQIGEFNLVELIKRRIRAVSGREVVAGPGDDAFVAKVSKNRLIAGTCDVLVEDIHFSRDWARPEQIGYKSITVNLSDLAAMGWCEPKYAMIGLALDKNTSVQFVDGLYKGMNKAAKRYGLKILGGDTVSCPDGIMISVSLVGELEKKYLLRRSGARPGDIIAVSGYFGDSAAGLEMLKKPSLRKKPGAKYLINKHLLPEPRLALAKELSLTGAVTSMIDSSDGLSASLKFITEESGAAAEVNVEDIPLSRRIRGSGFSLTKILDMAVGGGEEYELVFTLKAGRAEEILNRFKDVRKVGRILKGKGVKFKYNGRKYEGREEGFQHFQ